MRPASSRRLQEQRSDKCRHRLSKTLPGGKTETPGTRGACEKESANQGSE